MTYVRGQARFVYQRVFEHLRDSLLVDLGWNGETLGTALAPLYPYGTSTALTFVEQVPDPKLASVALNTVAFTEGRLPDEDDEELGAQLPGGLVSSTHTFFVDIYGEKQSIAAALGGDIRDLFTGRLGPRAITLPNYLVAQPYPALAGHILEFSDVELDFPAVGSTAKLRWAVVKLTATHAYNV